MTCEKLHIQQYHGCFPILSLDNCHTAFSQEGSFGKGEWFECGAWVESARETCSFACRMQANSCFSF